MAHYAVIGSPVSHSKSPIIHGMFAEQTKQNLHYDAIRVEAEDFESFVSNFFAEGGGGLNVTVPHKERAYKFASKLEPRAELAGAVNTLFMNEDKQICGDNTDGPGLVRDLEVNHGVIIKDKKVLVIGAGGAVRGALVSLIEAQPATICLVNRTVKKALHLQKLFQEKFAITVSGFEELEGKFDLVVNGTSLSLEGKLPAINNVNLAKGACCYDMMYADTDTVFVAWAKNQGTALALDGLGMLVEQAAESFLRWRGIRPETRAVISAIRNQYQR